ncbi:hypothetical protein N7471_003838 [Penicillium samsonianum]|uniref:uncharacterized protein n=1 Tax=Penicillium samsonianum TaxID=1882272 RepID=UPI0025489C5D|nr:uncharacterized protein N7471_003838 [Penicillium samsonianum]KAJ6137352.1 hypothetical protein N7471_003838 [Penicillium samsonianum]
MVTLDHQNFWQPTPNSPQRCSSIGSDTQTALVAEELKDSGERRGVGYYTSETGRHSRSISPNLYHNDASATDSYPDYPEEVALYPSCRVSSTPSVTGFDGPGTTRVFDVFEDDHNRQNGENNHEHFTANRRKGMLEDLRISSTKGRLYPNSTAAKKTKSRRRRSQPGAGNSSLHDEESYADDYLAGLGNAIRYLKRFYSLSTAEAKFSDDLADANIIKENLAVVQLATKTLQHAYGIIATSTIALENPVWQATTVQARQTITRRKWTVEEDRRLLRLRDSQKLPWSRIRDSFPGRTPSAVKQRYFGLSSKQSESTSSKENHPSLSGRHENCTSNVRRSQRLSRSHQLKDTRSNGEHHRRYPSRTVKHSGDLNASRLDSIDPRLRSLDRL